MLTTHEVTAAYCVTDEDARQERDSAPRWYALPEGWTWALVAAQRMLWGQPAEHLPIASAFGVTAWGIPVRPARERIRLPFNPRSAAVNALRTAACARKIPGGQLAARKAVESARFLRLNTPDVTAWG